MSLVAAAELESVKKQVAQQQEYIQVHAAVAVVCHVALVAIGHGLLKTFWPFW